MNDKLQFGVHVVSGMDFPEKLDKYWMDEIEVDGVYQNRFNPHQRMQPMVDVKHEVTLAGRPQDTGHPMIVHHNFIPSEYHWIYCNRVVGKGERCGGCREIVEA